MYINLSSNKYLRSDGERENEKVGTKDTSVFIEPTVYFVEVVPRQNFQCCPARYYHLTSCGGRCIIFSNLHPSLPGCCNHHHYGFRNASEDR